MGGDSAVHDGTTVSKSVDGVNINIRCSNGSKFVVKISLESTVAAFKEAVAHSCDIPADQQRLIYKGRILKDDQTLQSYGILDLAFVFFRICFSHPQKFNLICFLLSLCLFS